jgi:hypothetical protein
MGPGAEAGTTNGCNFAFARRDAPKGEFRVRGEARTQHLQEAPLTLTLSP